MADTDPDLDAMIEALSRRLSEAETLALTAGRGSPAEMEAHQYRGALACLRNIQSASAPKKDGREP